MYRGFLCLCLSVSVCEFVCLFVCLFQCCVSMSSVVACLCVCVSESSQFRVFVCLSVSLSARLSRSPILCTPGEAVVPTSEASRRSAMLVSAILGLSVVAAMVLGIFGYPRSAHGIVQVAEQTTAMNLMAIQQ